MLKSLVIWSRLLTCLAVSLGLHFAAVTIEWWPRDFAVETADRSVEVALVRLPAGEHRGAGAPMPADVAGTQRALSRHAKQPSPTPQATSNRRTREADERGPTRDPELAKAADPAVEQACAVVTEPPPPDAPRTTILAADVNDRAVAEPPPAGISGTPVNARAGQFATASTDRHAGGGETTDAVPIYRSNPLPEYPLVARRRHWEGNVWLRVRVSSDGGVLALEVDESSGHRVLDRAAARAVRNWRFVPASRAGVPVECQVRIPVRFELEAS